MSKFSNNNIVKGQFDGLDGVVTFEDGGYSLDMWNEAVKNDDKLHRVGGGIINWMTTHGADEKVVATDFKGSRKHRGVASVKDVDKNDLEYAYKAVTVSVSAGVKIDDVKPVTASAVRMNDSIVVVRRSKTTEDSLLVVVQLDRRVVPEVAKKINEDFAEWLKKQLTGNVDEEAGEVRITSGKCFDASEVFVQPADLERDLTGCKDNDYVKSINDKPYQVKTTDMMKYLKELPQVTITRADHLYDVADPRIIGKIKETKGGTKVKIWDKKNEGNFNLILNAKLPGMVRYNSMEQQLEVTKTIENPALGIKIETGVLNNTAVTNLKLWAIYAAQQPLTPSTRDAREVADAMGHLNPYNPFFDYLNSIPKWDGTHRLERMFIDSLGVDDNAMTRFLPYVVTVGMIYLQAHPGAKCDYVIDLLGEQGVGKTTLIKKLCNSFGGQEAKQDPYWNRDNFGWYLDDFLGFTGKDNLQAMTGKVYLNDDELVATKKSDPETVKKFATQNSFTYRKAYDINHQTYQRSSILWRTTNELSIYLSKLGQRKFWPMTVHKDRVKTSVLKSQDFWTPDWVDQLWAEALHDYLKMGPVGAAKMLADGSDDSKYASIRDLAHASLQKTDDITIQLVGFVYDRMAKSKAGKTVYFATQELIDALNIKADISKRGLTAKISAIMRNDLLMKPARPTYKNRRVSGYASTPGSIAAVKESAKAYGAIDGGVVQDGSQGDPQDDGTNEFELNLDD